MPPVVVAVVLAVAVVTVADDVLCTAVIVYFVSYHSLFV